MKKLLFSSMLLASAFAVLGSMNAFRAIGKIDDSKSINQNISTNYSVKYQDCISQEDFPRDFNSMANHPSNSWDWSTMKVDASLKKYSKSMDSTLQSLNSIDAHNFIHQEFLRSKSMLENTDISDIRKYYHCEIMRMCYDSDRFLNHSSPVQL
ncbi:hypothetical protein [Flagellimonas sediminis]|uniref:Uncharacterized protein n=1 Tax=Flagellimonas sediminis TaxID=2696468 RepID=A0A6I5L0G0_9FLAO|nr:hypothetical protein [Allomuricauda sediminis]NDV43668.1 hypothetical protein [Allomuricauda sediminis]